MGIENIMSRKNIIIGGVLLIVILIVGSILLVPQGNGPNGGSQISPTVVGQVNPTIRVNQYHNNYKEFLSSGKSEICTFSVNAENGTSNGTVYAANGKIRGDFGIPTANGETVQQHMLIDSYMAYMWTNANTQGVKFAVEEKSPEDLMTSSIFDCRDWVPNLSAFEIPANITFMEISHYVAPTNPPSSSTTN